MRRLAFPAFLMAVLLAVGAACGGDDGGGDTLTLEEYFTELAAIGAGLDAAVEPSVLTFSTSEDPEELRAAFAVYPGAIQAFIDGLEDLEPPAEVAEEHEASIAAAEAFRAEVASANEAVQDTTTVDGFLTAADTPQLGTLSDELTATCVAMQAVADSNGFDIDLGCES